MDIDELPAGEYAFPGPLRDVLVGAILEGLKTSTTSLYDEYEMDGEPLPEVGDLEAVLDSRARRVCITRNTSVTLCRLAEVSDEHARKEGEGYDGVRSWRAGHEAFWHSEEYRNARGEPGFTVDDDTRVVCVEFEALPRD